MKILFLLFSLALFSCEEKMEVEAPVENTDVLEHSILEVEPIIIEPYKWKYDSYENHFFTKDFIQNFHNEMSKMNIKSAIIVHDGYIIDEYYASGYTASSVFPVHSCSKSITSALFGIALEKGFIKDVNAPIYNFFPELDEDSPYSHITLAQLLSNTSGIKTTENDWYNWRSSSNWTDYLFHSPVVYKPGSTFSYSTGNTHLLSNVIERVTGKNLFAFAQEVLLHPIGMTSATCGNSPEGVGDGGNGFRMTAKDMALFGLLYLQNGNINGKQIISEDWIKTSTSAHVVRHQASDYGYQWWINSFGKHSVYFANGHGEQFIFVIPDTRFVITFTSGYNDNSHFAQYRKFVENILLTFDKAK